MLFDIIYVFSRAKALVTLEQKIRNVCVLCLISPKISSTSREITKRSHFPWQITDSRVLLDIKKHRCNDSFSQRASIRMETSQCCFTGSCKTIVFQRITSSVRRRVPIVTNVPQWIRKRKSSDRLWLGYPLRCLAILSTPSRRTCKPINAFTILCKSSKNCDSGYFVEWLLRW